MFNVLMGNKLLLHLSVYNSPIKLLYPSVTSVCAMFTVDCFLPFPCRDSALFTCMNKLSEMENLTLCVFVCCVAVGGPSGGRAAFHAQLSQC